ncbi:hypothetical protein [Spiroplasma kunkelii]|nr:hypothetical protein [Spiroplasma kunkelii]
MGGKKIYFDKYVKDINVSNSNIVIQFDKEELPKINEVIKDA